MTTLTLNPIPVGSHVRQTIPLLGFRVTAGFPSPADDYLEGRIDLNGKRHLSTIPDAITYFKRRVVARFELAVAQRDSKEVIL